MTLAREEVTHIALLARLGLSEAEVERFREQLSNILEQFEVLNQVDTASVLPFSQATPLVNITRTDEVSESLPQQDILANAPQQEGGSFRVRAVLE